MNTHDFLGYPYEMVKGAILLRLQHLALMDENMFFRLGQQEKRAIEKLRSLNAVDLFEVANHLRRIDFGYLELEVAIDEVKVNKNLDFFLENGAHEHMINCLFHVNKVVSKRRVGRPAEIGPIAKKKIISHLNGYIHLSTKMSMDDKIKLQTFFMALHEKLNRTYSLDQLDSVLAEELYLRESGSAMSMNETIPVLQ